MAWQPPANHLCLETVGLPRCMVKLILPRKLRHLMIWELPHFLSTCDAKNHELGQKSTDQDPYGTVPDSRNVRVYGYSPNKRLHFTVLRALVPPFFVPFPLSWGTKRNIWKKQNHTRKLYGSSGVLDAELICWNLFSNVLPLRRTLRIRSVFFFCILLGSMFTFRFAIMD